MNLIKLSKDWTKREYKLNQILIHAGDEVSRFYYVSKGYVKVYSISEDGEERILLILKPGDLFPLLKDPNQSSQTSLYFYQAMTDVVLHMVEQQQLIDGLKHNSEYSWELLRYISEFNNTLTHRLAQLENRGAEDKLASLFTYLVSVCGKPTKLNAYLLDLRLTHQDIASLLGLTRETVSNQMKAQEKKGAVAYRNGYLLINTRHVSKAQVE